MCGVEEYPIVMSKKTLHTFWKNPNVENDDYKSQLDAYITVLEVYVVGITAPPTLVDGTLRELYPPLSDPKNVLSHQSEAASGSAKEKYLVCMILAGENNAKFEDLKYNFSNSYLIGDGQYPNNR